MLTRDAGDDSSLSADERRFGEAVAWTHEEADAVTSGDGFTRVTLTKIDKEEIRARLSAGEDNGRAVCRQLAHLYHYYLHGPRGNVDPGAAPAGSAPPAPTPGTRRLPCGRLALGPAARRGRPR